MSTLKSPLLTKQSRVIVLGLGLHGGGLSVVRYLLQRKIPFRVIEKKTRSELRETLHRLPSIQGTFGSWKKEDLQWATCIIKNPGVPKKHPIFTLARKRRIPVISDMTLFLSEISKRIDIAVTGTRGKSTTTALIAHALKEKQKVFLGGNLRVPVLNNITQARSSAVVLELSSWQIEDADAKLISPRIGVFTNILRDHLNRYDGMKQYFEAKKKLFVRQLSRDFAVLNYDQIQLRTFGKHLKSHKLFVSLQKLPRGIDGSFVHQGNCIMRFHGVEKSICRVSDIPIHGSHNVMNVLFAIAAVYAFGMRAQSIKKQLRTFKGLPGRMELRRIYKGVAMYNDTTATTPDALYAGLITLHNRFPVSKIHCIAGGADKALKFSILQKIRFGSKTHFYLLQGSATKKLARSLPKNSVSKIFTSLEKSFQAAVLKAKKGDILLLSPGAASFNMFKHEFDRGDQFNALVESLPII